MFTTKNVLKLIKTGTIINILLISVIIYQTRIFIPLKFTQDTSYTIKEYFVYRYTLKYMHDSGLKNIEIIGINDLYKPDFNNAVHFKANTPEGNLIFCTLCINNLFSRDILEVESGMVYHEKDIKENE